MTLEIIWQILSLLLQRFVGRVFLIPSVSMEPTLHGCTGCTGDRIVVDRVSYRFDNPQAGDVVVFKGPESWNDGYRSTRSDNPVVRGLQGLGSVVGLVPPDENDLVKRVIAVRGQTVQCQTDDDGLKMDGNTLTEPYIDRGLSGNNTLCQGIYFGPITVTEGNIWVMGDNHAAAIPLGVRRRRLRVT